MIVIGLIFRWVYWDNENKRYWCCDAPTSQYWILKNAVGCDGKCIYTVILWVMQLVNMYSHSLSYSPLTVKGPRYAMYPADRSTSPATLLTMKSRCCTVSFQRTFSSASPPISWRRSMHHHDITINIEEGKYVEIKWKWEKLLFSLDAIRLHFLVCMYVFCCIL